MHQDLKYIQTDANGQKVAQIAHLDGVTPALVLSRQTVDEAICQLGLGLSLLSLHT